MKNPDVRPPHAPMIDPFDPRQQGRRRRWRFVIGTGLIGVTLGLLLLVYAQSESALIHIYLPILSHRLGARVQVSGGTIHWNGQIHLSNLKLAGNDGEPAVQVEQIKLKLRPFTLAGSMFPAIDEIVLINPRLRIRVDREGHSNLGYARAANQQKNTEIKVKPQRTASAPQPFPVVRLGRLEIKNFVLDYADAADLRLVIDQLDLVATNMIPGKTGNFELTLAALVERRNEGIRQEGKLKVRGNLTQKTGGQALGWKSSLDLAIKSRLPHSTTTQSITLASNDEGSVTANGQWEQNFQIEASTPQGPAAHGQGELIWDDARRLHRASLKIQGIGPEILNPLLTPLGKMQIANGGLDAGCRMMEDAKGIHLDSSVTADRIGFRLGKDSPPVEFTALSLIQNGTLDPAKRGVHWDPLEITIDQARFRKAVLERVKANFRQENGILDFRIERGKLCGGELTLHLEINLTRREPRYTWKSSLNGSDLAALLSISNESAPAANGGSETTQTDEEPKGRISSLLHAIDSRAKNVMVDITDLAGATKPKPRRVSGKASITSHGTGQGSGEELSRTLESETEFEIRDGEIQGFFVLDALAIATGINSFRTLVFNRSSGTVQTREGKAVFREVGVSGALQKVELTGQYDLVDHSYDLQLQPAIGSQYLDKITNNPFLPHLIRDSQGYFTFPFEVSVKNDSAGRRKVMVFPKLPLGMGKMGKRAGETVRGAVGGVIKESNKIVKKPHDMFKNSMGKIDASVGKGLSKLGGHWRGENKKEETE